MAGLFDRRGFIKGAGAAVGAIAAAPLISRTRAADADPIQEMVAFAFGFPTSIRLPDGDLLATWWASLGGGPTGISWARLRLVQ